MSLPLLVVVLAAAAACSDSSAPASADTDTTTRSGEYSVRDLTTTIGDSSTVFRLNNSGELLGIASAALDPAKRPFIWKNGVVEFIDGCGVAEDLNNSGAVLCLLPSHPPKIAIWRNGVVTPFAPFDTVPIRATQQLNDSGYVSEAVANVSVCGTAHYCALVVGRPTLTVMPSVVPMNETIAINSRGDVLAEGVDAFNFYDQPTLLFDAAGDSVQRIVPGRYGAVVDLNDNDHAVGWAKQSVGGTYAFYWHGGTIDSIGPGSATSLNNSDVVVGTNGAAAGVSTGNAFGFRWHPGSSPMPLDSLIDDRDWKIESASLINDAGQIAATGSNSKLGVLHHLVLLEPRPANP